MNVDIDLKGAATREEFHERVRQTLPVPEWYGNNLDALYDVITEQADLTVRFLHAEQLPPRYAAALERMSKDSKGKICVERACGEEERGERGEEGENAGEEDTEVETEVKAE